MKTIVLKSTANSNVTHSLSYDNEAVANFSEGEILTFGGGSTATLVSLTDNGTDGVMEIELLTGSAPLDNETIVGGTSTATADVDGNAAIYYHVETMVKVDIFSTIEELDTPSYNTLFTGMTVEYADRNSSIRGGGEILEDEYDWQQIKEIARNNGFTLTVYDLNALSGGLKNAQITL